MLTKEYRIPLPLTVEEYRIAQLYMIARKSRQESHGEGSGVEILINEPYTNGPGPTGEGQYTKKIYHIGSHLPGWFKSLLPKSALTVEEEAWNAYPYTKTRYTCPFVDKFSLEIETIYTSDGGHQENIFNLKGADLQNRVIDLIDVVKDQLYGADYLKEEDPLYYVSRKNNRGPLNESWIEDYWNECKGKPTPLSNGKAIMCAYKLCKVEFKYWGMQTKIERFIHDVALRKTMLRAHRQAWAWQDEWCGLTMDDVRAIERETQEALARTMQTASASNVSEVNSVDVKLVTEKTSPREITTSPLSHPSLEEKPAVLSHMECIRRDSDSDSQDEFFDCEEMRASAVSLNKWSSLEYLPGDEGDNDEVVGESPYKCKGTLPLRSVLPPPRCPLSPHPGATPTDKMLVLVFHAGTVVDTAVDVTSKKIDVSTFRHSLESVARQHYPALSGGRLLLRLIPIPPLCAEALASLSLLATHNLESPQIPLGALPLFAIQNPDYQEHVSHAIQTANQAYQDCLKEGLGTGAHIAIVGDAMGGIVAYDALCRSQDAPSRYGSENSIVEDLDETDSPKPRLLSLPNPRRRSSVCSEANASTNTNASSMSYSNIKLDFEVVDLFLFGCPLGLVAAFRKAEDKHGPPKPAGVQVYNLYHPTDPLASRLEPLLWSRLSCTSPYLVPRYQRFPLGDGQPSDFVEFLQQNSLLFNEVSLESRRLSEASILSMQHDNIPAQALTSLNLRWWGQKRLDYALYCPEGLVQFPTPALPPLLHASFWESADVVAFICRMLGGERQGEQIPQQAGLAGVFSPSRPCEKWLRKRTSVKIKNIGANHRGSDVIVREGAPQTIVARFMYGPLDVVALTGEKVDVYLLQDSSSSTGDGECSLLVSDVTDRNGRLCVSIPTERLLPIGFHSLKLVVRGDHTSCVLTVAVLPPRVQAVVFSIDGSFTASMSVTGRDPKVRAGAVDVVRHWQELGYMILYITGRPDMQQKRVVSWLAQHNFPHGLVSFADGLTTEPLRHKADYLRGLVQDVGMELVAAYGSAKDIGVYGSLGLKPHQIYIVGKVAKKQSGLVSVLAEGYASHLAELTSKPCKPALPSASFSLPRGCMAFPGNHSLLLRRRSAKRATSFPMGTAPGGGGGGGNLSPPSSSRDVLRSPSRQPRS